VSRFLGHRAVWRRATLLVALTFFGVPAASAAQSAQPPHSHATSAWSPWGHGTVLPGTEPHTGPAHWVTPFAPHVAAGTAYATYSYNWSGQIATGSTFSGVTADWVVPAVQPTTAFEASGTWIGIDGGPGSPASILQTGTGQATQRGSTYYYAWYEVYPNPPVLIGSVSPGDEMQASISPDPGWPGVWLLDIGDATSAQSASEALSYSGISPTLDRPNSPKRLLLPRTPQWFPSPRSTWWTRMGT